MPRIRKYIESHWLFYAFQGLASLVFGGFILFTSQASVPSLAALIGVALLCFGVIETFNLLYRKHYGGSLALSLILAVSEVVIALMLLFTKDYNMAWPLTLIAIYAIGRGVLEIVLSFAAITDLTDRFMWTVCGICGCVIGVAILNSGGFVDATTFIKFFGAYMMIYGITNLFYGVHNRNELAELNEAKAFSKQSSKKSKRSSKQSKQSSRGFSPKKAKSSSKKSKQSSQNK